MCICYLKIVDTQKTKCDEAFAYVPDLGIVKCCIN